MTSKFTIDDIVTKRLMVGGKRIQSLNLGTLVEIDPSYNVGIGTSAPKLRLDISGSNGIRIPVGTTTQQPAIGVNGLTDLSGVLRYNTELNQYEAWALDGWQAFGGSNLQLYNQTANPKIQLTRAVSAYIGNNDGGVIEFCLKNQTDSETYQARISAMDSYGQAGYGSLVFSTSGGGNPVERMTIDHTGNVGIGETNPGEKLEVVGNIKIGGNIQSNVSNFRNQFGYFTSDKGAKANNSTAMGYNTDASANSIAMGYVTTASGQYSTAMGRLSKALGYNSTAMGYNTDASGNYSTAMGRETIALGTYSTAMGWLTKALAIYSTAMGRETTASGESSTAMGYKTTAEGNYSTAIGMWSYANASYSAAIGNRAYAGGNIGFAVGCFNGASSSRADSGNNNNKFVILNSGNVGIGTTSPNYTLEVKAPGASSSHTFQYKSYFQANTSLTYTTNTTQVPYGIGIYCDGGIYGNSIMAGSDRRIKENIREVDDSVSLQRLRDISCCYYEYKDKLSKGSETEIGFIAQQVRENMPIATSLEKMTIPNEMRNIENPQWTITSDPSGNNSYKLTIPDLEDVSGNTEYRFYVSNEGDEIQQEISSLENEPKSFIFEEQWNNVFLYGKKVDDFHALIKDKLFALNFSATQEIDRIQQQEKAKLATAEAKITTLEAENTTLKARLDAIEAKLILL